MIDAHQMNVFLLASQTLNFSEAARQLNMTQPSVSQHIRSLENRFGVKLFERFGRRMELTEAGQALIPLARQMVMLSVHIEDTMDGVHEKTLGHLSIGCCTSVGRFLLPLLLARFREQFEDVQVTCHITDHGTALEMLSEGRLHIVVSPPHAGGKDIEVRHFLTDPIWLVAAPDHVWAQAGTIEPEDLSAGEFIMREETSGSYQAVASSLSELNIRIGELTTIMVLGAAQSVSLAVQEGLGVAFLARIAAAPAVARGDLAVVKVEGLKVEQDIWLARYMHFPATRAQRAFWDFAFDPSNEWLRKLRSEPVEGEAVPQRIA